MLSKKTDDFTVVYAGSIWGGYRDVVGQLTEIARSGIETHVYMLNDFVKHQWDRMEQRAEATDGLHLHRRFPFATIKAVIQRYHAGLHFAMTDDKTSATYGMKPLEYAYAGVVPFCIDASLDSRPAYNLSDDKEFGYVVASPDDVEHDFNPFLLKHFDYDYHLMDTHIHEFKELKQ
jgi:hypothetical protein